MPRRVSFLSPLLAALGMACASGSQGADTPPRAPSPPKASTLPKASAKASAGTAKPAAKAPNQTSSAPQAEAEEPSGTEQTGEADTAVSMPSECASSGELCLPPAEFTQRLCSGKNPDVAVYMMQKGQPWTRGYIRVENVDTVNTLGGPAGESKLVFGEEVVILRGKTEEGSGAGMQVSGMGGFIVLRWDGTCATLAEHELVTWVPGLPRHAPLVWKYLGDGVQEALLLSQRVRLARKQHRAQCKGARFGRSTECLRATEKLNDAIVVAVRTGTKVPFPERVR
jgi:hypothetical protein